MVVGAGPEVPVTKSIVMTQTGDSDLIFAGLLERLDLSIV